MGRFYFRMAALVTVLSTLAMGCASERTSHDAEEAFNQKTPKELSTLHTELGTQALLRGDYSQAVEDLRKALSLDSNNAMAHSHLGIAYIALSKKAEGRNEIERATEIDPNYSDAWINLGKLEEDAGLFKKAEDLYKRALENLQYKTRHRALTNLAALSLRQNKNDEARKYLYQSLMTNPDYCETHFLLGTLYTRDGNHARAAESFKRSVKSVCDSNIEGHLQLGLAYVKARNYAAARSQFKFLVEQYPQSTQAQKAGDQLRTLPENGR